MISECSRIINPAELVQIRLSWSRIINPAELGILLSRENTENFYGELQIQ
jgi:hypothetical protein